MPLFSHMQKACIFSHDAVHIKVQNVTYIVRYENDVISARN